MTGSNRPHKNLEVWKESIQLVKMIYNLCHNFPVDEKFGLVSQLKRASVSVPANIAEGAARQTNKEFYQFLSISSGSLSEIDTLIEISLSLEIVDSENYNKIFEQLNKVTALLNGLKRKVLVDISKNEGIN